jgi:GntR family transcriptional regulator of arabinose operon
MTIDRESGIPKYHQLKDIILQAIRDGGIREGEPLPSESELVRRFAVSRNTVRQAIGALATEGLVVRRRGKRTFCQAPPRAKTSLLGVITPMVYVYIYRDIINGIEETVHTRDYSMILGNSNSDPDKERSLIETMLDKGVEGLLIEPARSGLVRPDSYIHRRLANLPVPVVLMDCAIEGLAASTVTPADVDGGRLATEYLLQKGHKRIAILYKSETTPGLLRHQGYRAAFAARGLEPEPGYAVTTCELRDRNMHPVRDAVLSLVALGDRRPTAMVFYNDEWAVQGLQVLLENGLEVPRDVSIIGFDDTEYCDYARVPITSVSHPKGSLGRIAAEMLLSEIEAGPACEKKRVTILPRIVERQSVSAPASV